MKRKFSLIFFVFLFFSCNNVRTKEQYLKDYESFIHIVKDNYKTYTNSDWQIKDVEFSNYSSSLYNIYASELTFSESVRLKRFEFVYNLLRGNINLKDFLSGKYDNYLNQYVQEFKNSIIEAQSLGLDLQEVISVPLINKILNDE
jgi:hypothetical protein